MLPRSPDGRRAAKALTAAASRDKVRADVTRAGAFPFGQSNALRSGPVSSQRICGGEQRVGSAAEPDGCCTVPSCAEPPHAPRTCAPPRSASCPAAPRRGRAVAPSARRALRVPRYRAAPPAPPRAGRWHGGEGAVCPCPHPPHPPNTHTPGTGAEECSSPRRGGGLGGAVGAGEGGGAPAAARMERPGSNGSCPGCQLEGGPSARAATALATVLIFTIVVDVLGNALVILSVLRNKKLRNAGESGAGAGGGRGGRCGRAANLPAAGKAAPHRARGSAAPGPARQRSLVAAGWGVGGRQRRTGPQPPAVPPEP